MLVKERLLAIDVETVVSIAKRLYDAEGFQDVVTYPEFEEAIWKWLTNFITEFVVPDLDWWIDDRSMPSLNEMLRQVVRDKTTR